MYIVNLWKFIRNVKTFVNLPINVAFLESVHLHDETKRFLLDNKHSSMYSIKKKSEFFLKIYNNISLEKNFLSTFKYGCKSLNRWRFYNFKYGHISRQDFKSVNKIIVE